MGNHLLIARQNLTVPGSNGRIDPFGEKGREGKARGEGIDRCRSRLNCGAQHGSQSCWSRCCWMQRMLDAVAVAPLTRARGDGHVPAPPLSAEGRLRRAGAALWGTSFRDEGKHGEPQDREQGETNLHGRGGANRRGGAKPRGRNARRTGCPSPKGSAETRGPGGGLPDSERWRGDLWTTPGEEVRLDQAGPHGSGRDGRVGVKVRRVAHSHFRVTMHPGRKDLEGPGAKSVEGRGGERRSQAPRNRLGISPRGWPPNDGDRKIAVDGANPSAGARERYSQAQPSHGMAWQATPMAPRRGELIRPAGLFRP
jgi:hypothetical protein